MQSRAAFAHEEPVATHEHRDQNRIHEALNGEWTDASAVRTFNTGTITDVTAVIEAS
jgi:hypothetical protein